MAKCLLVDPASILEAFFEHAPDVDGPIEAIAKITKPGGYGVHVDVLGATYENFVPLSEEEFILATMEFYAA